MLVDKKTMLLGLIVASLAGSAFAAAGDGDPFARQRKQAATADSQPESSRDEAPALLKPANKQSAKASPAARSLQPAAPLLGAKQAPGLLANHLEPMGTPEPTVQRAGSVFAGTSGIRTVQHLAEPPSPDEPLEYQEDGFVESMQSGSQSAGPPLEAGVFEEPFEFHYDQADPDAPAPTASSGEWIRNGHWYTEQSVVYMNRSANAKNKIDLAVDLSSATVPHYVRLLDIPLDAGFAPGMRSTIGRYVGRDASNRDHAVEFTFLGLNHWRVGGDLVAVQPGSIFSVVDTSLATPAFNASDQQSFLETSSFNSYELSYRISRRPTRDRLIYTRDSTWVRENTPSGLPSLFGGLRVIQVKERLHYLASSSTANGVYDVLTHNSLVGLQGGGDWFYERPSWRLGMRVKGGMLVNWADQSSHVSILDSASVPVVPTRDERSNKDIMALLGEISFIGSYQVTPKVAFRVSYDLLWVTNLALAQNQINFTPSSLPVSSFEHSLFYTGASVGFEINR